jgi:hypothetical protein
VGEEEKAYARRSRRWTQMKYFGTEANGANREKPLFSQLAPVQMIFPYLRQTTSICGQFEIWLRLAALGHLSLFAANQRKSLSMNNLQLK